MSQPDLRTLNGGGREPNPRLLAIGLRIAKARKAAGMRQEDVAEKIGLSRSSIANMEAGRQELTLTTGSAAVDPPDEPGQLTRDDRRWLRRQRRLVEEYAAAELRLLREVG